VEENGTHKGTDGRERGPERTVPFPSMLGLIFQPVDQSFSTFFSKWHTEQGAKIVNARHKFLKERFYHLKKTSNKITFKSSTAKILITVLFLKIMMIMNFDDFFSTFPQTSAAHLRTLRVTPTENRCRRRNQHVPSVTLHGATCEATAIFTVSTARTSNLTQNPPY
jgi:hypothetical protein